MYDGTAANKEGFLKNEEPKVIAACNQNPFPPAGRDIVANGDVTIKFEMKDNDTTTK